MNTKLLMSATALALGATGIALSFFPQEIASITSLQSDPIILQLLGALYFAFALLNWMNKEKMLGGIYGRPIVMANFTHFMMGALALIKLVMRGADSNLLLTLAISYAVLGTAFGFITFTQPKLKGADS